MSKLTVNNQLSATSYQNLQKDISWLKENKKKEIRRRYDALYKYYRNDSYLGIGVSSIMLLAGLATRKDNPISIFVMLVGILGVLGYPYYKPKKEKFDEAMQKELNEVV